MSQHKLTISLSPHVYDRSTVRSIMVDVLIALLPVFLWSIYIFGLDAIRITVLSVSSCILFEYVIQKFILKRSITIDDGSAAVTGLLFAFNLPSHLPGWIIILGCFFCIGVAKMTFGGLGNNPFNPALAGRVFFVGVFSCGHDTLATTFGASMDIC